MKPSALLLLSLSILVFGQNDFVNRLSELETDLITTEECDFWIGVFKLAKGKSKSPDFCESELLKKALIVDSDSILGVVWIARNMLQIGSRLKGDILARLTTMPFWLNQGGKFTVPFTNEGLNHWDETNQLAWLVGGYFIAEAFQRDRNRSDIIFGGLDQPAMILRLEARQRLWRWLDQKLRFGFSKIESKSMSALFILATLAEDEQLRRFANMILHLHLYEIQTSFWQVNKQ